MTPAERQRRHRDIVTQKPMTKSEGEDLAKLIRNREKVLLRQRSVLVSCSPSSSSRWLRFTPTTRMRSGN